jgi:predicted RNase H-like HicB family nuclease
VRNVSPADAGNGILHPNTEIGDDGMTTRTYTAVLQFEDGTYIAECLEIGTAAHGHDVQEALQNLTRSTEAYLRKNAPPPPFTPLVTTFEVQLDP